MNGAVQLHIRFASDAAGLAEAVRFPVFWRCDALAVFHLLFNPRDRGIAAQKSTPSPLPVDAGDGIVRSAAHSYFPSNSSAWARALFALLSPSIRASSLTRALRLPCIGSMVTIARSFVWSFTTTK